MFTNINLTDMETGYKMFRREIVQSIRIEEKRFGIEPEITAKIAKTGCRIYEVGISYYGRTYKEDRMERWHKCDLLHITIQSVLTTNIWINASFMEMFV